MVLCYAVLMVCAANGIRTGKAYLHKTAISCESRVVIRALDCSGSSDS